jgi:TM2 domain-containing membrane protein YozV
VTGTIWFSTFGLFGVGWIVDFFLIPAMDREAELKYDDGPINYNITWLLCTYLGFLGAHRFYMRKWFTGILWALTGGLLTVGWLYDFCTLNRKISDQNLFLK